MYAILNDRGRQHTVREGDVILIDHAKDHAAGQSLSFDQVLLTSNEGDVKVGTPNVDGASVSAEILGEAKGDKLVVFRFKRRKQVRVKKGHRQAYTRVRITGISG